MEKNQTYTVTYVSCFREPYWREGDGTRCLHKIVDTYVVDSAELCKAVVRDFLDAPTEPMTKEMVMQDYSSPNKPISDAICQKILDYYNGRLELQNCILKDIDNNFENLKVKDMTYPISKRCNYFSIVRNEPEDLVEQCFSHIRIIVNEKEDTEKED